MDNQQNVRRHSEPGFSLIEVILAIGMLSTVMISISSMFILGGRQMQSGKKMTEATVIAQDIMEMFEEQSFTLLYTGLGAADPAPRGARLGDGIDIVDDANRFSCAQKILLG